MPRRHSRDLTVEIGQLMVECDGPVDALALRAALEAELSSLFAAGGWPGTGGAVERLSLRLPGGDASLGAQLGQAVHGAVTDAPVAIGRGGGRPRGGETRR